MKDNVRFPAGGNNFDFNVGRVAGAAGAAAAQGAAAAAAAGAAAGAAAQPIKDGLTLSGAANSTQANIFAPAPTTKNNPAADAITDGLKDIVDLGKAVGQEIAKEAGAWLAALR